MQEIKEIENLREEYSLLHRNISQGHPDWNIFHDTRITIISKCVSVLDGTHLSFIHFHLHLSNSQWWQGKAKDGNPISNKDIVIYKYNFETFTKIGFIHGYFSAIESSVRVFMKTLDPNACNNGTAEFKSIYSCLLKRLNIPDYINILDLLRLIRNTIHNNGVYFHKSNKNESVTYKGKEYSFEIGKLINFVTWEFLCDIISEMSLVISAIILSEELSSIAVIDDPAMNGVIPPGEIA